MTLSLMNFDENLNVMLNTAPFTGKVALVTGSTYGIGRATAIAFAQHGASVVCSDWENDIDTVKTIQNLGGKAIFIRCNVAEEEQVKALVDAAVTTYGQIDFAFNNAGIEGAQAPLHESDNGNWEKVIGINLNGTYYGMKHQIAQMLRQGGGVIVNNASIAGLVGFQGVPAYVASKHAVVGLTRNAALDYARHNIRINVVCPGVIKTPMIDRFTGHNKAVEEQLAAGKPIGRIGEPEEVASGVMWLCTEGASFVIGHALPIDGGWVVQ